jgi:medium-chain acyl-[acyl-carrier-protein] hydrolase
MTKRTDAWFQTGPACEQAGLNLFCFPYAGGAALVFKKWWDFFSPAVQVIPVELPGRGARLQEPPFVSLPALINELEDAIQPLLDSPFVLFGHSMGAIIAFELGRSLRRKYGREPQALFVAGRRAPQAPDDEPITYNLPKDKFIEELIKLDGTPREVIEHAELMELMLPLLRADFQMIQTYEYLAETPLSCPITVFGGLQDIETPREKLLPWKELTCSRFALHMLSGDHFFIRSSQSHLLRLIARELNDVFALYPLNNAQGK